MSIAKFLLFIIFIFVFWLPLFAQTTKTASVTQTRSQPQGDELSRHLSGAETYQLAGDLPNAAVENQAIISIALKRMANLALKEDQPERAVKLLGDSIAFGDNAETRLALAAAYMRSSEVEKAIAETQNAVRIDNSNASAHYLLGRLFYTKGDYAAALPELEKIVEKTPDFDTAYALGVTYLQLKQIDRAKLLFEEMQGAIKDNNSGLHILFGRAFEEAEYHTDAENEFKRALAIDPKTPKAHFFTGYLILQHGGSSRLPEAAKEFEEELKLSPQDFYTNFFLGVVASSESEHPKAISYLQQAVKLNPKSGETYLFLGQSQVETGDTVNAEKNLRRAIELSASTGKKDFQLRRAHFLLGRLLIKSGRKDEGEKELIKAREMQGEMLASARDEIGKILGQVVSNTEQNAPSEVAQNQKATSELNKQLRSEKIALTPLEMAEIRKVKSQLSEILAQAFNNLGVIAAQQGLLEEAVARFAAAGEWKPDFPGLDRNWGITGFRANQFDKAVPPLARYVKAHPEEALTRRMLGVSYYLTQNYKQTVETLRTFETTLATDPELTYFYGISLVRLDKQPQAAVLFARLADQNAKSAQARFYAAQGFALIGDFERAVKEFRTVAQLDSSFALAHYNAGQSLIRLNRLDEAEKEFRQELQLNAADASSKYYLAYTLLERKIQTDEAMTLLKEAVDLRYDYADARYQLGKALIEKGNLDEAVDQLETAARFEPKKDYIHYQLSIAYRRASRPADSDRELKLYRELKSSNRAQETPAAMGAKENAP